MGVFDISILACGDDSTVGVDGAAADAHADCKQNTTRRTDRAGRDPATRDIDTFAAVAKTNNPGNLDELFLTHTGPDSFSPNSYVCHWTNPRALSVEELVAWAICLTPPGS